MDVRRGRPESQASNKAKIAKRVIEVLEYFDDQHREATVMDIVRRYDRPQSSTSELLSSLVELGLLHKDPYSRSYSLTARAALLGVAGQAEVGARRPPGPPARSAGGADRALGRAVRHGRAAQPDPHLASRHALPRRRRPRAARRPAGTAVGLRRGLAAALDDRPAALRRHACAGSTPRRPKTASSRSPTWPPGSSSAATAARSTAPRASARAAR